MKILYFVTVTTICGEHQDWKLRGWSQSRITLKLLQIDADPEH
jgi:hypothetical protein